MSKSQRLRLFDVRRAFRLIGDCRDLWADSAAWRLRSFEGVMHLVGGRVCIGGEFRWPLSPGRPMEVIQALDAGFGPRERTRWGEFMRDRAPHGHPLFRPLRKLSGRLNTRTRTQLMGDSEWYREPCFDEYHKPIGVDHSINSLCDLPASGTVNLINLHRALNERDFSGRERRLLHLFHDELGRLVGTALKAACPRDLSRLPRRLRQTLECLLEGDSEKQVALRLGLSRPTVHQYVTALYRHFGVAGRAELLALHIRRPRTGPIL